MAEFNVGDLVVDINNNQRGSISKVLPFTRGDQKYSVFWCNGQILGCFWDAAPKWTKIRLFFWGRCHSHAALIYICNAN